MDTSQRFEILAAKPEREIQEGDFGSDIYDRVPVIAQYLLQYHQDISQRAKQKYPDSVHLDNQGIAIIKQTPLYHSYSIWLHGTIAFGVADRILGLNYSPSDPTSQIFFDRRRSNALSNQIEKEEEVDEESDLRGEVLKKASALIEKLNLTPQDKLLIALEAGMHDIGKYAEPELKNMERLEGGISIIRIKRSKKGKRRTIKNPFYKRVSEEGILEEQKGPDDHLQDELTVTIYKDMYRNGLLSGSECNLLVKIHEAFTQLSIGRYLKSETGNQKLFESLGDRDLAVKAVILLAVDEISKGNRFLKDQNAKESRINKFNYLLVLLDIAEKSIAERI